VIGDGTLAAGVLYEAMNIASLMSAPVLILVENNGIAQTTPQSQYLAGSIAERATAFGLGFREVDSRDIDGMRESLTRAISETRGGYPQVVSVTSYRLGP